MQKRQLFISEVHEAWAKTGKFICDDADTIWIDEKLLAKSRGAFNKTMNGRSACETISIPKTILEQARHNLIESFCENRPLSIQPLALPVEYFTEACMRRNTSMGKLSIALNEVSIDATAKSEAKTFPPSLNGWISKNDYETLLNKAAERLKNISKQTPNGLVPMEYAAKLRKLRELMMFAFHKFELHIGHAGCGKSTAVAKILNETNKSCVIYSLSNTIGNMFKQKVPRIEACSFAKLRYTGKSAHAKIAVIDEFSQIGAEWLDEMILIFSDPAYEKIFIMGDIDQMPTFLGSGSLLYSTMEEFPNNIIEHKTNYRAIGVPALSEMQECVLQGKSLKNKIHIFSLNDEIVSILEKSDCVITGANDNVDYMNRLMICIKYGLSAQDMMTSKRATADFVRVCGAGLQLICNATKKLNEYRFTRNERVVVQNVFNGGASVKSLVTGAIVNLKDLDLNMNFVLGYAITVNRAQGLEWQSTVVYITSKDKNLMSFNAMYVALSRAKDSVILLTCDDQIKLDDIDHVIKHKKYKYINIFKEIA